MGLNQFLIDINIQKDTHTHEHNLPIHSNFHSHKWKVTMFEANAFSHGIFMTTIDHHTNNRTLLHRVKNVLFTEPNNKQTNIELKNND